MNDDNASDRQLLVLPTRRFILLLLALLLAGGARAVAAAAAAASGGGGGDGCGGATADRSVIPQLARHGRPLAGYAAAGDVAGVHYYWPRVG